MAELYSRRTSTERFRQFRGVTIESCSLRTPKHLAPQTSSGQQLLAYTGYVANERTVLNSSPDASLTYTDSTVTSGTTYYYIVTAVDGAGIESAYSNQSVAVIPTP